MLWKRVQKRIEAITEASVASCSTGHAEAKTSSGVSAIPKAKRKVSTK